MLSEQLYTVPPAAAATVYKEWEYDKTAQLASSSSLSNFSKCGSFASVAECSKGDATYAKVHLCGKEWCSCSDNDGPVHERRQSNWLPKVMQLQSMGYFVIEFPNRFRKIPGYAYTKHALQLASTLAINVLAGKRTGGKGASRKNGYFKRGLLRYHYFGDKPKIGKHIWNPHMNIIVDGGYLSPDELSEIKAKLRVALKCPELIVNYRFTDEPRRMMHILRYVTRATFRSESWDERMASRLYNFRNCRWWGNWKQAPAWTAEDCGARKAKDVHRLLDMRKLETGHCKKCGAPLKVLYTNKKGRPVHWSRPVNSKYLDAWHAQAMGGGYYEIPQHQCCHEGLSAEEVVRLSVVAARIEESPEGVSRLQHKHRNYLARRRAKEAGVSDAWLDTLEKYGEGGLDDWIEGGDNE